jgi:hypothetical protein
MIELVSEQQLKMLRTWNGYQNALKDERSKHSSTSSKLGAEKDEIYC